MRRLHGWIFNAMVFALSLGSVITEPVFAREMPAGPDEKEKAKDDKAKDQPVITERTVMINGLSVAYRATSGTLPLMDDNGKTKANIFFVAYERLDGPPSATPAPSGDSGAVSSKTFAASKPEARPITFAFNGGPGSSSVWLHIGALGPRRVEMGPEGEMLPPPARLVDNEFSWLDMTDLVFIDPVSTGYSRAVEGEDPHQFHGLDEDVRAVGEFIRLYCTRYKRWASPKFLTGESYGTTRASALSGHLQDMGMYLNGIILISPVLNFATIAFDTGNDMPYWLFLPSYTATAWYHKKLAPELQGDLEATLREARAWASGDYLKALAAGDAIDAASKAQAVEKLARYTGLSKEYCDRANLRIRMNNFGKELLRDHDRTIGRFDSRYKGIDRDGIGSGPDYDPSYAVVLGPFGTAFNHYARAELNVENDRTYEILTGRVQPWNFGSAENRYANVAETLRRAMTNNPNLKVLIASGYYDLATPFFAAEYTATHLGLAESMRGNITQTYYPAGHMMYLRHDDLAKLKQDAAAFVKDALPK